METVAVVGGKRTPFVKALTAFKDLDIIQLGAAAVGAVVDQYGLAQDPVDQLVFGTVIQSTRVSNLAREVQFATAMPRSVPASSVIRACATGLQAITDASSAIMLGHTRSAVAGGAESLSDVQVAYPRSMAGHLNMLKAAKTTGQKLQVLSRIRGKDLKPEIPAIAELLTGKTMGEHCEEMAKQWGIPREDQDALALASHLNTAKAWASGRFADEVITVAGCAKDNLVRPDTSVEKLAKLPPVFDRTSGQGTLTAGNSSPLTDGASAVLLASVSEARRRGWPVLATIKAWEYAGVDPMQEGLLMAPAYAIPRLLDRAGLQLSDIDRFEIHEAFAAQVLCTVKALNDETFCREKLGRERPVGEIPREKLNVQGGSIAVGHPFGATGGRLILNLATQLATENLRYGLISICAAGGLGGVALLERVPG